MGLVLWCNNKDVAYSMSQKVVPYITDMAPSTQDDGFIAREGEMFNNREHTGVLSATIHHRLPTGVLLTPMANEARQ